MIRIISISFLLFYSLTLTLAKEMKLITPKDIMALKYSPPTHRVSYDHQHPSQFGDLRLPNTPGPHTLCLL